MQLTLLIIYECSRRACSRYSLILFYFILFSFISHLKLTTRNSQNGLRKFFHFKRTN